MKKKSLLIVLISLVGVCVMAQERYVIRGNVCNEDGQPMVGANIYMVLLMVACVIPLAISRSRHL